MTRKAYAPTAAHRRKIAICAGGGMAHSDIAVALRISRGTLLKYYADELDAGAFQKRMDVIMAVYRSAARGNGSAAKIFLTGAPQFVRMAPARKPKPLGKKVQAQADAATATLGTDWEALLKPNGVH